MMFHVIAMKIYSLAAICPELVIFPSFFCSHRRFGGQKGNVKRNKQALLVKGC